MAVIMDNVVEEPRSIVMVDDGQGFLVSIPTVLISSEDGAAILENVGRGVVLSLHFETIVRSTASL